jgi:hypothetical protein
MIATTASEMGYANAQPGSIGEVYAPVAADTRIFPTDAVKAKLTLVKPLAPDLQVFVDQLWMQIKGNAPQ